MARSFYLAGLFVITAVALSLGGCGDDDTSTGGGNGGDGGTGPSTVTASATTGMMAGSGGSGGGAMPSGYCGKSCAMPADCCPMGSMGCPGPNYPNNWTCDSGSCGAPQCAVKDDCTFNGALPDWDCLTKDNLKFCADVCMADADCTAPLKCIGDAGGTKYCTAEATAGCMTDADCMGYGKCKDGACSCTADADCTGMGVDKCVMP